MMGVNKRSQNEKDFANWKETSSGGRLYWFDVMGRNGGKARYVKEVDNQEKTITFRQEIFTKDDNMIEIHEKYPVDKGHLKFEL